MCMCGNRTICVCVRACVCVCVCVWFFLPPVNLLNHLYLMNFFQYNRQLFFVLAKELLCVVSFILVRC